MWVSLTLLNIRHPHHTYPLLQQVAAAPLSETAPLSFVKRLLHFQTILLLSSGGSCYCYCNAITSSFSPFEGCYQSQTESSSLYGLLIETICIIADLERVIRHLDLFDNNFGPSK
jgi:hypothetical protein